MKLVAAMIVKNEEAVIARCLDSLVPRVHHTVINDNGSTDDTPRIIGEYDSTIMVPGDWVNFATNRNLALDAARRYADYVLCGIDADEELVVPEGFEWPELTADAYTIPVRLGSLVYPRVAIVKSTTPWYWKYPVQEGLYCDTPTTCGDIPGVYILSHRGEGARSKDPDTQKKDLTLLVKAVADNPADPRMVFYLAQQYKDMHDVHKAREWYQRRLGLGGFEAERWYSMFMLGRIDEWLDNDPTVMLLRAFEMDPTRAEPLFYAADWHRRNATNATATLLAQGAAALPLPESGLFVERDIYEWRALDLLATVAWYTPFKLGGRSASVILMTRAVPEAHMARVLTNHAFYTSM